MPNPIHQGSGLRGFLPCVGVLIAAYLAMQLALSLGGDYFYSTFPQPILFYRAVIGGKYRASPPKVLILGDSTAVFNLAADRLPSTLSLAMFASSFVENYYTLKNYLEKMPAPNCVVITSSYAWKYQRRYGFFETFVFHNFYSLEDLREIYDHSMALGDFPANEYSRARFFWEALLYRAHLHGLHLFDSPDSLLRRLRENKLSNEVTREKLRQGRGTFSLDAWHYVHNDESLEHLHQAFVASPLNDDYLQRLLTLAAAHHIRVHWFQAPVAASTMGEAAKKYFAALDKHLARMFLAFDGNSFRGTVQSLAEPFYANPTHLNTAGVNELFVTTRPLFDRCQ